MTPTTAQDFNAENAFNEWLTALEARHLASLTRSELTRALRALSSCYVERRNRLTSGSALDGAGKRAAFALFYAPLHFLTLSRIVRIDRRAGPMHQQPARLRLRHRRGRRSVGAGLRPAAIDHRSRSSSMGS